MLFPRRLFPLLAASLILSAPARAQQPTYRFSHDILAQWKRDSVWSNYQNHAVQFSQIGDYVHTLAAQSAFEKGRNGGDTNVRFDPAYLQRFHAVNAQRELRKRTASRQLGHPQRGPLPAPEPRVYAQPAGGPVPPGLSLPVH